MKTIAAVLILSLSSILLCACGSKNVDQYYLCSDLYKCCEQRLSISQKRAYFDIYLVGGEEEPKVEISAVKGKNLDQCEVNFKGFVKGSSALEIRKRGHRCHVLEFELFADMFSENKYEVFIDSMTLRINDQEAEYAFPNPLHFMFEDLGAAAGVVNAQSLPMGDSINSFMTARRRWDFCTEEDVLIESVSFNQSVKLSNIQIGVVDATGQLTGVKELKDGSPVSIDRGQSFSVVFDAESADASAWTNADQLTVTFSMKYTEVKSGMQFEYVAAPINIMSHWYDDAVEAIIDYAMEKMGKKE